MADAAATDPPRCLPNIHGVLPGRLGTLPLATPDAAAAPKPPVPMAISAERLKVFGMRCHTSLT